MTTEGPLTRRNVTLKDVARQVGVSAMTVSRALSGKSHLVNAETVERCRRAAAELGYVPNLMARSLRGEQLATIVMFAEYISSHHYLAELVDTVARAIEARHHSVISCQSLTSFRQALRNFKLAGAVIIAPPEQLFTDRVAQPADDVRFLAPVVLIHSAVEQDVFNEVSPDIRAFSYAASKHLLELGHRELGYLGGPRPDEEPRWFEIRRRGIEQALAEHGLPPTNLRFQACPDAEVAPSALQQLLSRAPRTTGVLCINDEVAVAAVVGAEKMGLAVPGRLSVVGCNNIKLAGFFRPAVTTLAIDIRSMVETALNVLFDDMRQRDPDRREGPIKISIPADLVVRESTGPPPSGS